MFSIYILGAGFSRLAGLPLGNELTREVLVAAKERDLYIRPIKAELSAYFEFIYRTTGTKLSEKSFNIEDFLAYLDVQTHLGLEGSDLWSVEGSPAQIAIRNLIAFVLHEKQRQISEEAWRIYERFVANLDPTDYVLTFNYDSILEQSLERMAIPYRLFNTRLLSPGVVDSRRYEIAVLKLHGSADWFWLPRFEERVRRENDLTRDHLVIRRRGAYCPRRIAEGWQYLGEGVHNIFRVEDMGQYFRHASFLEDSPFLVLPSSAKFIHLPKLSDFWYGLNQSGAYIFNIAVVGFSLPNHDMYCQQALYNIIRNFQEHSFVKERSKVKFVDFRQDIDGEKSYKQNFRFVNWKKARTFFEGFSEKAIDFLFDPATMAKPDPQTRERILESATRRGGMQP